MASPGYEDFATEHFSLDETPEHYAARCAHRWGCFSFHEYRYSNEALTLWIQRLGDILFQRAGEPSIEHLRQVELSPEERRQVERELMEQRARGEL